jgi:hypothetical protein
MRYITSEELELIVGASNPTAQTLPPVTVTGNPDPGGNPGTGPGGNPGTGPGGGTGTNPTNCIPASTPADRADQATIFNNEGGVLTKGYTLPPASFPNSGLSIGAGVDLGQHTASDLTRWGISQAGLTALTPYFGLKGNDAVSAVTNNGGLPTISTADANAISSGAFNDTMGQVSGNFNGASTTGIQFNQLPQEAQTVIMDIAYNSGSNLAGAAPHFWTDVTTGNWQAAVSELNSWTSAGTSDRRHTADANLLQQGITNGALPSNDTGGVCP